jgi:hypothetical protein
LIKVERKRKIKEICVVSAYCLAIARKAKDEGK